MRFLVLLALALAALGCQPVTTSGPSTPQRTPVAQVQITPSFQEAMNRDLGRSLQPTYGTNLKVTATLLREGPTQTGVSLAKYYAWVVAAPASGPTVEGAARLAEVSPASFEVTDFLTAEQIVAAPSILTTVFPEALREKILRLAQQARGTES